MTPVRRALLPVALGVGIFASVASPEPAWARYVLAVLWASVFVVFSWWLAKGVRTDSITSRSYGVALHFWVLSGIFCYTSVYAARHAYPVPPYLWIIVSVLVSLLIRMLVPTTHEQDTDTSGA